MIRKFRNFLFGSLPNDVTKFYNGIGEFSDPAALAWSLVAGGHSAPSGVDHVDFINLASYREILVIVRLVTTGSAVIREMVVSTDNGGTFLTASGDYKAVGVDGVEINDTSLSFHGTSNSGARSGWILISNFNQATNPKIAYSPTIATPNCSHIIPTTSGLNALRVRTSSGGVNFTGGDIYVFGRGF